MDIILYNIGVPIILLIIGYLFGSIPNAIWIGKVFFHKDPRDYGSGNAGGTNAGRVFGKKVGLIVIFLDAFKLVIPLYLSWLFLIKVPLYHGAPLLNDIQTIYVDGVNDAVIKWPVYWVTTIGCSIGHCFPLYAKFKGGKNVSSFVGALIGVSWLFTLIPGISYFVILKAKKYVSLASLICSWLAVTCAWVWAILILTGVVSGDMVWFANYAPSLECNYVYAIVMTLSATLLTVQHRTNIIRLMNGTERKITWM